MSQIRRHLAYLEALIPVPRNILVILSVLPLGEDHLLQGDLFSAVDGVHILLGGFIGTADVIEDMEEILRSLRYRLIRILHIVDEISEFALDMPEAGCCHITPPPANAK